MERLVHYAFGSVLAAVGLVALPGDGQASEGFGIARDLEVCRVTPASIRRTALELGRSDRVDAVFVSCTGLRAAGVVPELERELGKPVTSSNHAMAWHALRLAGYDDEVPGRGSLFARPLD